MSSVYQIDQQWFRLHPTIERYQRASLPTEWPDVAVPHDAVVTVYWIIARCTVRALQLPAGPHVATVIDTDPTDLLVPVLASWASEALAPDGQRSDAGVPWAADDDPPRQISDILQRERVLLPAHA